MASSSEKAHRTLGVHEQYIPPMLPTREERSSDDTDLSDYFVGPYNLEQHSKCPTFLRLRGSITPEMILPLLFVGAWSTAITCISKFVFDLGIHSVLLTVLGFVVALALSFRSTTAYERYSEGRKYWSQLVLASHNLARLVWVHAEEREGDLGKQDLLAKLTCMNLIVGFAIALKHHLRFEPYTHYEDLQPYVQHLHTYARAADIPEHKKKHSVWKKAGLFLGIPMAQSNPRKELKHAKAPLGNLPLEILTHLSAYMKSIYSNETLTLSIYQTQSYNAVTAFNDVLTGTERILNTPLPIAYSIAISQITWVYILILPFQLFDYLGWVTIPASLCAGYIILGIALIGQEIENPFGTDVNDLSLDAFCEQIRRDVDVVVSRPAPRFEDVVRSGNNALLWPVIRGGYEMWNAKTVEEIREALGRKVQVDFDAGRHRHRHDESRMKERSEKNGGATGAVV